MLYEKLSTPKRGEYDVIVCGGGVGGIAAAVSAARHGAKVLLIEKSILLGGLATIGLISWFEPLCDGFGQKIMYGLVDELFDLSMRYGDNTSSDSWKKNTPENAGNQRYTGYFSPTMFAMALDTFCLEEGITLLLDTVVVRPVMESNHCLGIVVENKTGRGFYAADFVIDATGDADILYRAGVPCENGKNYLTYTAYLADRALCEKAAGSGRMLDSRKWFQTGSDLWGRGHPEGFPRFSGTTAEEVTEYVLTGRRMLFERLRNQEPSGRDITVLPAMAQFRTTRRLAGGYTLTESDAGKHFSSSVSTAVDFFNRGKCYELPAEILYHPDYDNLLTAGRTVSSSDWAWEVTRVIPVAIATGQGAGTAAALCCKSNKTLKSLDSAVLRQALEQDGVKTSL